MPRVLVLPHLSPDLDMSACLRAVKPGHWNVREFCKEKEGIVFMFNPARCVAFFVVLCLFLSGCTSASRQSTGVTSFSNGIIASGMARLDDRRFLVVNDTPADQDGPKLGLIDLNGGGSPRYLELPVNWDEFGGPANELEAICTIPGRDVEFLAAESRHVGDRFGRVFHIIIDRDERGLVVARIEHVLKLPQLYDRIEGRGLRLRG